MYLAHPNVCLSVIPHPGELLGYVKSTTWRPHGLGRPSFSSPDLRPLLEKTRFPLSLLTLPPIEDNYSMKNTRLAAVGELFPLLLTLTPGQKTPPNPPHNDPLQKNAPSEGFFPRPKTTTPAQRQ